MKNKIILAILLVVSVYAGGYLWLRHRFDTIGTRLEPDATGEYHSVHRDETTVWIDAGGPTRPVCQVLHAVYLPAGKLEEILTGRKYWSEDERLIDET